MANKLPNAGVVELTVPEVFTLPHTKMLIFRPVKLTPETFTGYRSKPVIAVVPAARLYASPMNVLETDDVENALKLEVGTLSNANAACEVVLGIIASAATSDSIANLGKNVSIVFDFIKGLVLGSLNR